MVQDMSFLPVDLTSILKDWGLTIGLLSLAATAVLAILVLSFREFALWFFGIAQLKKNQKAILDKLEQLETTIALKSLKSAEKSVPNGIEIPPVTSSSTNGEIQKLSEAEKLDRFQLHS